MAPYYIAGIVLGLLLMIVKTMLLDVLPLTGRHPEWQKTYLAALVGTVVVTLRELWFLVVKVIWSPSTDVGLCIITMVFTVVVTNQVVNMIKRRVQI
jgi:hypothetical protein